MDNYYKNMSFLSFLQTCLGMKDLDSGQATAIDLFEEIKMNNKETSDINRCNEKDEISGLFVDNKK